MLYLSTELFASIRMLTRTDGLISVMFPFFSSDSLSWQSCICKMFECRQTYCCWGSHTMASKWSQHWWGSAGAEVIQPWHVVKQPSHGSWETSNSNTQTSGVGFRVAGCSYRSSLEIRWKETGDRRQAPMNLVAQWFKMPKSFHSTCVLDSH